MPVSALAYRKPPASPSVRPVSVSSGEAQVPPDYKDVRLISKIKLTDTDVLIERVSHPAYEKGSADEQIVSTDLPSVAFMESIEALGPDVAELLLWPPDYVDEGFRVSELRLEWKLTWEKELAYRAEIFCRKEFDNTMDELQVRMPKLLNRQEYEKGRAPLLPASISRKIDVILGYAERFYAGYERAQAQLSLLDGGLDDDD